MVELKIDPELRDLIPKLTDEELSGLEQSLIKEGCREAILTWNGFIIDGHNRFFLCTKNNIPFRVESREFESRNDVCIWMINNQFGRRNLALYDRCNLGILLKKYFETKAAENKSKAATISNIFRGNPELQKSAKPEIRKIDTREELAKLSGVSHDTFSKVEKIREKTPSEILPELENLIKSNNVSINQANKFIKAIDSIKENRVTVANKIISEFKKNPNVPLENKTKDVLRTIQREKRDKELKEAEEKKRQAAEQLRKEREEKERQEKERLRKEREEKEQAEKERLEREKEDQAKLEQFKAEQERLEQEKLALFKAEQERLEQKRLQAIIISEQEAIANRLYNVILCDPPWRYEFAETKNREIENQYPTMSIDEIKALQVPANDDCVLFLWATAPKLEQAFEVLKAWGFTYKTCAVWDKEKIGMGYWFRGQHELLLVGTKGNPGAPFPENRFSSVIRARREGHSEKPECIYNMIEKMIPNGVYLEMFARNKREKWASWGNQV